MKSTITLLAYQRQAQITDQRRLSDPGITFPLLGLFGETGSLLSEVKKKQFSCISWL